MKHRVYELTEDRSFMESLRGGMPTKINMEAGDRVVLIEGTDIYESEKEYGKHSIKKTFPHKSVRTLSLFKRVEDE